MLLEKYLKDSKLELTALKNKTWPTTTEKDIVQQEILESLQRSYELGISPAILPSRHKVVTLFKDLTSDQNILDLIEKFIKTIEGQNISFAVYEKNSCLIKSYIDFPLLSLNEGTDWSEQVIGTNAAALAIKHQQGFKLIGEQQYAKFLHSVSCFAEPIMFKEQIVGALAIYMPIDYKNTIVEGCLGILKKSIEGLLHIDEFKNKVSEHTGWEEAIVNTISEGFFSIDSEGIITYINSIGASIFGLQKDEVVGKKLVDVFGFRPELLNILETGQGWIDRELCLRSPSKGIIRLVKTATPIKNDKGEIIGVLDTFRELNRVHNLVNQITGANARFTFDDIIHESNEMQKSIDIARMVADSDAAILLQGESGTGKELFAHSIHSASKRAQGPFIVVDCAALPRELIESELFGYVEGAFTGAVRKGRAGKFELANGGTVFLDEIGELPLDAQAKLLRVLQTRTVTRIGDRKTISVDFRVIAATNKNIEYEVSTNGFREDLFYRINVVTVQIPPLRKRAEDILPLSKAFANKAAAKIGLADIGITDEALSLLVAYDWPGNVRELENVIERATYLARSGYIGIEQLPEKVINYNTHAQETFVAQGTFVAIEEKNEKKRIESIMQSCNCNISKVAKILGLSRPTLYKKIKEMEISCACK